MESIVLFMMLKKITTIITKNDKKTFILRFNPESVLDINDCIALAWPATTLLTDPTQPYRY